ncbi:MAG: hypothetical protein RI897_1499 [Verrucomicrobiota bacterium]
MVEVVGEGGQDCLGGNGAAEGVVLAEFGADDVVAGADGGFIEEESGAEVGAAVEAFRVGEFSGGEAPIEDGLVLDPGELFRFDVEAIHTGLDHFQVILVGEGGEFVVGVIVTSGRVYLAGVVGEADEEVRGEFEDDGVFGR